MIFPNFLRIATVPMFVYSGGNETSPKDENFAPYADTEIIKIASKKLGFSYEIVTPSDREWGRNLGNGSWSGTIGMLQRNEADIIIRGLGITEARTQVIDYTYPYLFDPTVFITRNLLQTIDKQSFLKPFSLAVWISVCASLVILPAIYSILFQNEQSYTHFLKTGGHFFRKSMSAPQRAGEVFFRMCWLVFQMFLFWSYAAVLLSFLVVPSLTGVRNIPELANRIRLGKYFSIALEGAFYANTLSNFVDPNMKIISQSLKDSESYTGDLHALLTNTSLKKNPAFITNLGSADGLESEYFISQDILFSAYAAIGLKKDFCCKRHFDSIMHVIWSSGIFDQLNKDFRFENIRYMISSSSDSDKDSFIQHLSLSNLQGVFMLLAAGYSIAITVFFVEVFLGQRFAIKNGLNSEFLS